MGSVWGHMVSSRVWKPPNPRQCWVQSFCTSQFHVRHCFRCPLSDIVSHSVYFIFFKFFFYFMSMNVYLYASVCTMCIPGTLRSQKKASDLQETVVIVSQHTGAGNPNQGLGKQGWQVLLITGSPLQSHYFVFNSLNHCFFCRFLRVCVYMMWVRVYNV